MDIERQRETVRSVVERLRGQMYHHPKVQYLRIDRREAEALVAVNREVKT